MLAKNKREDQGCRAIGHPQTRLDGEECPRGRLKSLGSSQDAERCTYGAGWEIRDTLSKTGDSESANDEDSCRLHLDDSSRMDVRRGCLEGLDMETKVLMRKRRVVVGS